MPVLVLVGCHLLAYESPHAVLSLSVLLLFLSFMQPHLVPA
jgi:hypothetical protein